jgi:hypothetical protein
VNKKGKVTKRRIRLGEREFLSLREKSDIIMREIQRIQQKHKQSKNQVKSSNQE